VANQQKDIAAEIVAAKELLLQELVLRGGERPREPLRGPRNILAANQVSEGSTLVRPSQSLNSERRAMSWLM
jgi:hypothetical protein